MNPSRRKRRRRVRRRHSPAALPHDLWSEILLRLPPCDPAPLVRLSAVCKPWRRLLSDPAFHRRYAAFHRAPPVLGLLCNMYNSDLDDDDGLCGPDPDAESGPPCCARFLPTTSFRPPNPDRRHWLAVDSRHGRILFWRLGSFVVWEPMVTGGRDLALRKPEFCSPGQIWTAAVLCATGGCDHLGCHDGPFLVVLVCTDHLHDGTTRAGVYSSEAGTWSDATSIEQQPNVAVGFRRPSVLIGSALYFSCVWGGAAIIEYDMASRKLAVIDGPIIKERASSNILMTTESGGLGFAVVVNCRLHLWSREAGGPNAAIVWAQHRVIDFERLLPSHALFCTPDVTCFADSGRVIFVKTCAGVFSIELGSGRVKKVYERRIMSALPYMSFYRPEDKTGRSGSNLSGGQSSRAGGA